MGDRQRTTRTTVFVLVGAVACTGLVGYFISGHAAAPTVPSTPTPSVAPPTTLPVPTAQPIANDWLSHHPRFQLHFTPTSASWMNQVETWFSIVHRKAIRRGVFRSVAHLKDSIQRFLDAWNANCHPFAWVKTADQILARAKPKAISGPVH